MTALVGEAESVAAGKVTGGMQRAGARFSWLVLLLAAWLVGGVVIVDWAYSESLATDVGWSPYHMPAYLGLLGLAAFCMILLIRAIRDGRTWRTAFPPGYGVVGAGLLTLLGYIVVDVGWREGVGIGTGIEGSMAPSRILLVIGLVLVCVGPLRAALAGVTRDDTRWPAIVSAGLTLAVLWFPGGFQPARSPWLERSADGPEDDSEVWVMDADGGRQTRLIPTTDGADRADPVWSPDGRLIAYTVWTRSSPDSADPDIWVAAADGTAAHPLVAGPGWQWIPRWSPDGRWIAYTEEAQGGPDMAAGPVPPVPGQGPLGPGFELAPTSLRQFADIWRVAADGSGSPERLTDAAGDDRAASYSPDGSMLVFDSTRDGDTEVYVMDTDGSHARRLTQDPAEDWGESWSPDGRFITFNSDRTGRMQLYVVGVDGGPPTRLTFGDVDDVSPTWSPDGARIAFTRRGDDMEIWTIAPDGSDPVNLTQSAASDDSVWDGSWAGDGRILYTRAGLPSVTSSPLVREDLAVAGILIEAIMFIILAVLVASLRPPFGGHAVMLGIATLLASLAPGDLRFVPTAIACGLLIDVLVRLSAPPRRPRIAGAAAGALFPIAAMVAVAGTTGLGWSPTLAAGVIIAAAALGWGIGAMIGRQDGEATAPSMA